MTDSLKPPVDRGESGHSEFKNSVLANGIDTDYCRGETSVGTPLGWAPQQGSFSFTRLD